MTSLIISAVICGTLAILFIVIRITKKPLYGMFFKIIASLGFVSMGVIGVISGLSKLPKGAPLIIIGLVCGLIGDFLIDMKRVQPEFEAEYLYGGMGAFAFGHAAYISAAVLIAGFLGLKDIWVPAIISTAIGIALAPIITMIATKFMKANFGKFYLVSVGYAALLVFLTIFTTWLAVLNSKFILLCLGMVCFLLSDLVLTTQFFVEGKKEDKMLVAVNHVTYYAAQILIASFIFVLI